MCGSSRQKANADVVFVFSKSAAVLTFEKPIRSGLPFELAHINPNMGDYESLNVFLAADLTRECGGDAKPVKGLSRFDCCGRCHASSIH